MVTMFEFLSPIADAIGLQLTAVPYRDSEIVVVFLLSATLLEISRVFWDLITAKASLIKLLTTLKRQ
jgi:hypothetical protein